MYSKYVDKLYTIDSNEIYKQISWLAKLDMYEQNIEDNLRVANYFRSCFFEPTSKMVPSFMYLPDDKLALQNNNLVEVGENSIRIILKHLESFEVIDKKTIDKFKEIKGMYKEAIEENGTIYLPSQYKNRDIVNSIKKSSDDIFIAIQLLNLEGNKQEERINKQILVSIASRIGWTTRKITELAQMSDYELINCDFNTHLRYSLFHALESIYRDGRISDYDFCSIKNYLDSILNKPKQYRKEK